MTEWHSEWQSKFPVTEIYLRKKDGQVRDRIADILIEKHDTIIEIEHSGKILEYIVCKAADCKLHNKDIIWIIDGNTDDVKLEELSNGQFFNNF